MTLSAPPRLALVKPADPPPPAGRPHFSSELAAEFLRAPDRRRFIRLVRALEYDRGTGVRHRIPPGFETDGGSIPRAAWWIVGHPLDGEHVRACVLHDWLCLIARQGWAVDVAPGRTAPATRAHADAVFLEALRAEELPEWRARLMYGAVRLAGLWKR